jgi:hypothetical protein
VNLKRLFLSVVMIVGLLSAITPLANAETEVIQGQIVSTNTTWGSSNKALKIEGLIQIRAGVTLTINPGSSLDVSKGSFLVLGSLSIIGNSTSQSSAVFAPSWLSGSGSVSISGLNIIGDGGSLLPYEVTGAISITNSNISGFNSVSEQTQSRSLVFSGNTVFKVSNFHANPIFHTSYSVIIVVLVYCCVGVLSCSCIAVLAYCCVGVLSCWCIVMLVYCHVGVLSCCCIAALVY